MTLLQKLITIAALAIGITMQHWPVKAADTIEAQVVRKLDEYMACIIGRVSISLYADYSAKGQEEANRYANVECKEQSRVLNSLDEDGVKQVHKQLVTMADAMLAGMRQMHVNPESNEHEPSEDANNEAKNKL